MATLGRRPRRGDREKDDGAAADPPSSEQERLATRRGFLRAAGFAVGGVAAGGIAGGAIGAAMGAQGSDLDFAKDEVKTAPGFDHLVVVMYENRSFDNLLGWLYKKEEVPEGSSFDGLHQGDYSNKVPGTDETVKAQVYTGSTDEIMSHPQPDPGEAYPHVNTQLFGTVRPESNSDLHANGLSAPYNAPDIGATPDMQGFVRDFIINYDRITANTKKISKKEIAVAMGGFSPEMLPVFSTLAKGFAVYDHWYAAVPSQTFCNRSFFHASTSHGYVTNQGDGGYDKWLDKSHAKAPTIFNRLHGADVSWRVYYDVAQITSLTGILHAPVLEKYWKTNFRTMDQFWLDVQNGTLPAYAFVEPRMVFDHNDMHPPYGELRESDEGAEGEVTDSAVSDVRAGEALLHNVYSAVKASASTTGSNAMNTMLLVTFDEHGGTYDHVPPPSAVAPGDGSEGEMGFGFDRLGCRVPAVAISAYTAANTIINDEMSHSSLVATLCEEHGLEPLTERDKAAPDLFGAVNLKSPRPVTDWPTTVPHYVPPNPDSGVDPTDDAHKAKKLSNPAKGLLGILVAKYGAKGEKAPDSYGDAYTALVEYGTGLFGTVDPPAS